MIPCYVCGKDIGGGWSIGFPPAPDSEKMGLCREHDLSSHRARVQVAWRELIYGRLTENTKNTALKAGDIPQLLSIYFTGGGAVSLPCSSISTIDGKTLKATTPGGEHIYFPLNQVRNYALSPLNMKAGGEEARRPDTEESRPEPKTLEADETGTLPVTEPKAKLPPAPGELTEEDAEKMEAELVYMTNTTEGHPVILFNPPLAQEKDKLDIDANKANHNGNITE